MSSSPCYANIHTHVLDDVSDPCILSLDTHESSIAMQSGGFYSLGLHPWFIAEQDVERALAELTARSRDPAMLAIGECGLDKAISTELGLQTEVFQRQIQISENCGKPLIIHCVRAFHELLQCRKAARPRQAWIIHGFVGKPQLAGQLIRQGFYLSFGKALLQKAGHAGRALAATPLDRLFLETDAATLPIGEIYAVAAKMTGLDVAILQQCILGNFNRVFFHD